VALITTLINTAIFFVLYVGISQQLNSHLQAHVDEVRRTLADVEGEESDGFQELAAMVARHAHTAQSDEDIYLLTDKLGSYISGNVSSLERFEGWKTIPWKDLKLIGPWSSHRASNAVIGIWTPVKGGYLFVGDGNGDVIEAQHLLLTGLLWGIGLSVVCAGLSGYILGLKAERRVAELKQVLDAVATGDLDRRILKNGFADDIDHVSSLINTMLDRLQGLIGNLKQVSVDIAHDLRTPISRMRQKLELVRSGADNISAYKVAIDASIDEIDDIADTFDSLLRISEIEAGARKAKFVEVELYGLLANIADALEAVAEARNHRLIPPAPVESPIKVRGDRRLLNQLFVNLIENSIVHCASAAEIRIELSSDNGEAIVRVRDTGPGIPMMEQEKVFRRLYRVEKSRTTRGSGLGLSLVAAITELHGAKIALSDNAPGLVTEIRFKQELVSCAS
jgi:signal transduction histidine kinase